jgi:hypothetical protein
MTLRGVVSRDQSPKRECLGSRLTARMTRASNEL